jgi:hypothetical protein
VKDKFKFSYSYEFPPFKSGVTATSAHELHLTLKFGKKKTFPFVKGKPKPTIYKRPANAVKEPVEDVADEETEVAKNDGDKDKNGSSTPAKASEVGPKSNPEQVKVVKSDIAKTEEVAKPAGRPARSFTITKGHYVVVAVFSMMDHSTRFTKQLVKAGYEVNVALNPKNKFYYVYIFSSYDLEEAKKMRNQYRWKNLFKEAWVFTMD